MRQSAQPCIEAAFGEARRQRFGRSISSENGYASNLRREAGRRVASTPAFVMNEGSRQTPPTNSITRDNGCYRA